MFKKKDIGDNFQEEVTRIDLTRVHDENYIFRIAIVDDQEDVLEREKVLVKNYFNSLGQTCIIEAYQNPRWLLNDLKENHNIYDLFLVDIEMVEMRGYDFIYEARLIYPTAYYMVVTSYEKYAMDGYRYGVFRYIIKPEMERMIPEAIDAFCQSFSNELPHMCTIKDGHMEIAVDQKDISYIYYEYKYSEFHVNRKVYSERISLAGVLARLNSDMFVQVNRSYVVNALYVRKLDCEKLLLINGDTDKEISVSRRRRAEVLNCIIRTCGVKRDVDEVKK